MIKWNGSVLEEAGEKGKEKFFKIAGENEDFEGDYLVKLRSGKVRYTIFSFICTSQSTLATSF